MSEHESVKMSDHESLERLRRNRSNLGFQSATGRTRRGEPDRSCRLPSPPVGRTRPVASLLVRDQAGCPFDETGRMPVLRAMRARRLHSVKCGLMGWRPPRRTPYNIY